MVVGLAFLILVLFVEPYSATAAQVRCLTCHPPHYAEQGGCVTCHRGNPFSSRQTLAHTGLIRARYAVFGNPLDTSVIRGKQLADLAACKRCHNMAGRGNKLASDLDSLLQRRTPEEITTAILKPAVFMPNFHFSPADRDDLATAILAGGVRSGKAEKQPPQVVYFNDQPQQRKNIFTRQCGGCHRVLTAREGGLGSGSNGPNLSGLLSPYYAHNFPTQLPWTADRLKRWLNNPRAIRKETLMRPVRIPGDEWQPLLDSLQPVGQVNQTTQAPLAPAR